MTTESTDQTDAPAQATEEAATATEDEKDWKAKFEELQSHTRRWEGRARANAHAAKVLSDALGIDAKDLPEVDASDLLSRYEAKSREVGVSEGRALERADLAPKLVSDAFRVAAVGRDFDVDGVLDDLKVEKFLGDDGMPNGDAVQQFVDKIAPQREAEQTSSGVIDLGQGARGGQAPGLNSSQLEKDLKAKLGIG